MEDLTLKTLAATVKKVEQAMSLQRAAMAHTLMSGGFCLIGSELLHDDQMVVSMKVYEAAKMVVENA